MSDEPSLTTANYRVADCCKTCAHFAFDRDYLLSGSCIANGGFTVMVYGLCDIYERDPEASADADA